MIVKTYWHEPARHALRANAVDADASHAIIVGAAQCADGCHAGSASVALIHSDTNIRGEVIGAPGGKIAAYTSCSTRDIARLARAGACRFAANAVHAKAAQTVTASGTSNAIFIGALMIDIAGLRRSRTGTVVLALGDVATGANVACNIARLAGCRARTVTTNAIDTEGTEALRISGACFSQRFLACPCSVTNVTAIRRTRRINGRGRIRRRAAHATNILRAGVSIDGFVILIGTGFGVPVAIAHDDLAIARNLSRR